MGLGHAVIDDLFSNGAPCDGCSVPFKIMKRYVLLKSDLVFICEVIPVNSIR